MFISSGRARLARAVGLALALGGTGWTAPAQQDGTLCFEDSVPLTGTSWVEMVTLPQFDPALGVLLGVSLQFDVHTEGTASVENTDEAPATVTIELSTHMELLRPDNSVLVALDPTFMDSVMLSAFDDVIDYAGTSGTSIVGAVADDSGIHTAPPPASDLTLFTGVGNVVLTVTAAGSSQATGSANLVAQFAQRASAVVTVCYTFGDDCNMNGIPDDQEAGPDCNDNGIPDDCEPDCDDDGIPDDCEVDCDDSGVPDDCEMFPDCNDNGIPDICDLCSDFQAGSLGCSEDCNDNDVPDECETDCNGNGTPDDCEVYEDCNDNDIPDECEPDCDSDGIPDDCELDCNGDGTPDDCEIFEDCNQNGIPDECDLCPDPTAGPCSQDCDQNGVPDECQPDCDKDGVPDACEVDCNANGTPDDCEVFEDCNANGIPDECDFCFAVGGGKGPQCSEDCDENGVPDECQPDCDGDGIPDACNDPCQTDLNCEEFDRFQNLTPQDTFTVFTSNHNPQQEQGYAWAYAVDAQGRGIGFDELIGQLLVVDGVEAFEYGVNAVDYDAMVAPGAFTDVDADGIRDLDGIEYEKTAGEILVPRFLGQNGRVQSQLVLLGLSGGSEYHTTANFLVYNDDEDQFSAQFTFRCWDKVDITEVSNVFSNDWLTEFSGDDPTKSLGGNQEYGWFRLFGGHASSTFFDLLDPAVYGVYVEVVGGTASADLPFERCTQSGHLLPRLVTGDNSETPGSTSDQSCSTDIARRDGGSLLLFTEFDNRVGVRTIFTVTNRSATQSVRVHYVYIGRYGG